MKRHRILAKILTRNQGRAERQDYPNWLKNYSAMTPGQPCKSP